jgi:hypothetical protein
MITKPKEFEIADEYKTEKTLNRFMNFVDVNENNCWIWIGATNPEHYGAFKFNDKTVRSHKFSYAFFKGPIPDGIHVCHKCDDPSCCNPDHLFLGTASDNQQDCNLKDRGGKRSKLTVANVIQIKKLLNMEVDQSKIAYMYNVSVSAISRIKLGKRWSCVKIPKVAN